MTDNTIQGLTMFTASAIRSMAQHGITDTQYIMTAVQCKITLTALDGDSKCWVTFNIRRFKNKSNLKKVANDVVRILTENGFEAESETFVGLECEEYLRFKISWED